MSKNLTHQRCYNHAFREAAARCPECQRFFCRECVSEHDDRVLCASCLAKLVKPSLTQRFRLGIIVHAIQAVIGFFLLWGIFYGLGRLLLIIPAAFHEGTLWREVLW